MVFVLPDCSKSNLYERISVPFAVGKKNQSQIVDFSVESQLGIILKLKTYST